MDNEPKNGVDVLGAQEEPTEEENRAAAAAMNARLADRTRERKRLAVEVVAMPIGLSAPCSCGAKFEIVQKEVLEALVTGRAVPAVCTKCDADVLFELKRNLIVAPGASRNERRVLAKEAEKILGRR